MFWNPSKSILGLLYSDPSQFWRYIIHIQAEKGGKEGLVPSNFLEEMTPPRNEEVEVFAADEESMRIADAFIQMVCYVAVLLN